MKLPGRAARERDTEARYDRGEPPRDDIDRSLYLEFAAGDRATQLLVERAQRAASETDRETEAGA
jgi:hypothetical protein